ncbi:phosphotransferase family protein [Nocardia transvalensis]|uniref:phosphotransferase family protein n=1 Tax=Nocardia transvalensis TaxID=37333 RepID=UPI001894CD3B|nr:aminoglycoside phosphotransferase family protein [Nocardia transvalensis]MBF6330918.1 aminoglycoside phosphotransferase family protein [Nocardia transvalensis]
MDRADFGWLEETLGQPVSGVAPAEWGSQNRTDTVTLRDRTRVVVQRFRRRADAERGVRVLQALREPAAHKRIPIPQIRRFDLDADPPWIVFEALPGVPVPASTEVGPTTSRFPALARAAGRLLASFSELHCPDLELDDVWARPRYLAARADAWAECLAPGLTAAQSAALEAVLDDLPDLFEGRPVVLAHGDFAPVNLLVDGGIITGLVDVESVRLADPLFDAAWWEWSVSFAGPEVPPAAWPQFLTGAGMDPSDPVLIRRIRYLQVVRMLEMLAEHELAPDIWRAVHDRLVRTIA